MKIETVEETGKKKDFDKTIYICEKFHVKIHELFFAARFSSSQKGKGAVLKLRETSIPIKIASEATCKSSWVAQNILIFPPSVLRTQHNYISCKKEKKERKIDENKAGGAREWEREFEC